jgi:hypothetical protein
MSRLVIALDHFFAVLHLPPVTSPAAAVRAAIVAEHRQRD